MKENWKQRSDRRTGEYGFRRFRVASEKSSLEELAQAVRR